MIDCVFVAFLKYLLNYSTGILLKCFEEGTLSESPYTVKHERVLFLPPWKNSHVSKPECCNNAFNVHLSFNFNIDSEALGPKSYTI